jgi:hypothetical protein
MATGFRYFVLPGSSGRSYFIRLVRTPLNDRNGGQSFFARITNPIILLPLLPCLLLYPLFFGGCLLPANLLKDVYPWRSGNPQDLVPWNVLQFDGITQFYPWRLFAAETWRSGYVPLWNPHQFCGTPFLANGQSAVLYPPNLLFLLMPVKYAFGWSDVIHLAFTGVTAALFFRRAGGCSHWGSTIGGVCWQLSTWQISWLTLPTFLDTSSWLPSALLTTYFLVKRRSVNRAALLAVIIAMMMLAGHLQIAFYCLLLTVAYGLFLLVSLRLSWRQWITPIFAVVVLTFLLTAAQILPTVELSRLSPRSNSGASAVGYAAYTQNAMPLEQLAGLFIPGLFGHPQFGTYWERTPYPENAGYVGVVGSALALIAVCRKKLPAQLVFFAIVALVALMIAVGSPLDYLLYYGIPGFSQTGSPARILTLWTFSLAFLTAHGVDCAVRRERQTWLSVGVYAAIAMSVCVIVAVELVHRDSSYLIDNASDIRLFAGLLLALIALLWLFSRNIISQKAIGAFVFALVAVDLLAVNAGYNPIVHPADVYPVTPSIAWLQLHAGNDRIMPINTSWSMIDPPIAVLPPNAATVYGLYDLQGYDSLQSRAYKQFTNELDGHDSSPMENGNIAFVNAPGTPDSRFADAKYLISLTPLFGFGEPVITDGQVMVYEDNAARPIGGNAKLAYLSATRAVFDSVKPFDASFQGYPGWQQRATRGLGPSAPSYDGVYRSVPVVLADHSPFIKVLAFPPSRVELFYQPHSFLLGLYLTLIGILILAGRVILIPRVV